MRGHRNEIRSLSFSRDGSHLASASADGTARVWDVATGDQIGGASLDGGDMLTARFSPDGSRIVTASADGIGRLWQVGNGRLVGTLNADPRDVQEGRDVTSASFALGGARAFSSNGAIWNAQDLTRIFAQDSVIDISPDAALVVTDRLNVLDPDTGRVVAVLPHRPSARRWRASRLTAARCGAYVRRHLTKLADPYLGRGDELSGAPAGRTLARICGLRNQT